MGALAEWHLYFLLFVGLVTAVVVAIVVAIRWFLRRYKVDEDKSTDGAAGI